MFINYDTALIRKNSRGESYWGPLGLIFNSNRFEFYLWSPDATRVHFAIYENFQDTNPTEIIAMTKRSDVWFCEIDQKFHGYLYNLLIEHRDSTITEALDPYSYSICPFDWTKNEVPKSYLIDIYSSQAGKSPSELSFQSKNPLNDALIYELNIRDFSSKNSNIANPGTFLGALDQKIFDYLSGLNFNFLQLLPVHSCYTFSQKNVSILKKGQGKGHFTNYNWGYDPLGFFSINSSYSSNPLDPYLKIKEFKAFIDSAHKKNIGIILDVAFSQTFCKSILDDVARGYFYRDEALSFPSQFPPLDSQKPMAFRLILDSLIFFVKYYKVDGFRFDAASYFDKKSLEIISIELKKINPNIILFGKFCKKTDLQHKNRTEKTSRSNNFNFAYLNYGLPNVIRGSNVPGDKGLILSKNSSKFASYVSLIPGGIFDFDFGDFYHSARRDDLFANDISINVSYITSYDGPTLADKILTSASGLTKNAFIETYRQALMMILFVQGKVLLSSGTEFAFSKACDFSGASYSNCHLNLNSTKPPFSYQGNKFLDFYSNKTTDFTNGLDFSLLEIGEIKTKIFNFLAKIDEFRQKTQFFRLADNQTICDSIKFETVDNKKGLIIFSIQIKNEIIKVIHNFSANSYDYNFEDFGVLFNSKLEFSQNIIEKRQSLLLMKKL
ncbi:hypothetical protein [Mesomycoplasma ovipneumoniae]|uniref:hypothetical protein n=1 Tax=Mesomycoplasma ovipneumoniae TaxID=29562 RepID=UPI0029648D1F|nr:hypothetical protein [Mesomycoplasma ovipneumoniae]MDW2932878.1 pullulanase [Mesomycoplasma ovipneumoniae]